MPFEICLSRGATSTTALQTMIKMKIPFEIVTVGYSYNLNLRCFTTGFWYLRKHGIVAAKKWEQF